MPLASILLAAALLGQNPPTELPETVDRRVSALKVRWQALRPRYNGQPFAEVPNLAAFRPGRLQSAFVRDGLNALNFARYVAYLPDDVTLNPEWAPAAQTGALVNAVNRSLTHSPGQPAGMPFDLFETGRKACASSNLAYGAYTLESAIRMYLSDVGVPDLGHRRWCLNPPMKLTAFGFVEGYSNMHAFDGTRPSGDAWDAFTWPSDVAFPDMYLEPGMDWSVHLNPKVYKDPSGSVQVSVRLPGAASFATPGRVRVDGPGYGDQWVVVFRPAALNWRVGQTVTVRVQGMRYLDGRPARLEFSTRLIDLEAR